MVHEHPEAPPSLPVPYYYYFMGCRMIEVVFKNTKFVIHEPLLRCSSTYFADLLKRTAGQDDKVRIEFKVEGQPCGANFDFGFVNTYLYTGHFYGPPPTYSEESVDLRILCSVWLFAYSYRMPKLLNYAMWCILEKYQAPSFKARPQVLEEVYRYAPPESKLRKCLLDFIVWRYRKIKPSWDTPSQMGWDLFKAMREKESATESPLRDAASYYMKGKDLPLVTVGAAARVTYTAIPANPPSSTIEEATSPSTPDTSDSETETEEDLTEGYDPKEQSTTPCDNCKTPTPPQSTIAIDSDAESTSASPSKTIASNSKAAELRSLDRRPPASCSNSDPGSTGTSAIHDEQHPVLCSKCQEHFTMCAKCKTEIVERPESGGKEKR